MFKSMKKENDFVKQTYVAPETDVVLLRTEGVICASGGSTEDPGGDEPID